MQCFFSVDYVNVKYKYVCKTVPIFVFISVMGVHSLWRLIRFTARLSSEAFIASVPERVANGGGVHKNICLWNTADESKQSSRRPLSIMTATPMAISPQSVYL